MLEAVDIVLGVTITAEQALADRQSSKISSQGYQCPECHYPVFLRGSGKGDQPFFCHFQYSPTCPLRTGQNEWPRGGGDDAGERDINALNEIILRQLTEFDQEFFSRIVPVEADRGVAKFLSWGIDVSSPNERVLDTIIDENNLRLIYQERFVVLARWVCAFVARDPASATTDPDVFAQWVRHICVQIPALAAWKKGQISVAALRTVLKLKVLRAPMELEYVPYMGRSNCFVLGRERVGIVEVQQFPATLRLYSNDDVTISAIRHSTLDNRGYDPEEIRLGAVGVDLEIPEPQGIVLSPNYRLNLTIRRQPLLYIVPQRM